MIVERFPDNPLITPQAVSPSNPRCEVIGTFNCGAFEHEGRIGLLVRVAERPLADDPAVVPVPVFDVKVRPPRMEVIRLRRDDPEWRFGPVVISPAGPSRAHCYLTNVSHFRLAWSEDGRRFELDPKDGAVWPESPYETFGIEDPRVTRIGRVYFITYTAVSERGLCVGVMSTIDFRLFARHGLLLPIQNKDACLFPAKIGRDYLLLHRPEGGWCRPGIWLARSPDLVHWGGHELVAAPRPGKWDSSRIGAGPPPVRTDEGWLAIYHGAGAEGYGLGAMLLDLEDPARVLARSEKPLVSPEADYEKVGFVNRVAFCNGLVERPGGELWLYYGGADRVVAGARCRVSDVLESLK